MLALRVFSAATLLAVAASMTFADDATGKNEPVSYYKHVRPILQAQCQGCHNPAKASGGYDMVTFAKLVTGGDSGSPTIVASKPEKSYLVELITPSGGKAEMPQNKKPLADAEIALIRRWISEGAKDDSPASAARQYDVEHPPLYKQPPVISSLDYSPDGKLLAIAGFHEVLLHNADGSGLVARLIGLSERIESVAFSADGKWLAAVGGLPARLGEVQVWNVEERKLALSTPVTYDTLYGVSWSPDGGTIAFGCTDNSVRAINAKTGEQTLFMGSHNDWALDTVFSLDGSHLVSVGRDRAAKLTEVATQRFNDNITSITPGALKGGIAAVARHPSRNEIVMGGSDGQPTVYRMDRLTKRVIGDDSNLIRVLPALAGRIFGVDVSRDGKRIVAGSSLDGASEIGIYGYEFDTSLPDDIKKIMEKTVQSRSAEEVAELEKFSEKDVVQIAKVSLAGSATYTVRFSPDGQTIAIAGSDGKVRLLSAADGKVQKEFVPVPIETVAAATTKNAAATADYIRDVNPALTKLGCNAGTCHGAKDGKKGFKLSLRGYDPLYDIRALTDDHASRRVSVASPADSLMLLKATAAVPHEGGQVVKPGDQYYEIIYNWIAAGAKLDLSTPRVASIELLPKNPTVQKPGEKQQMRVEAKYANGVVRDVTREAFIESGNADVATASTTGELMAMRRGEAPILARYEGAYTASTLTVMGNRDEFVWQDPPANNRIDELVAAKWQRMKILPSDLCTDAEFIRRVYLDLTGLPPTAEKVQEFIADSRDTRAKRDALIDQLVGSDSYVEHWTNKWADLMQVNQKFLGDEGAQALRGWIRDQIKQNKPYDQFVRAILTASGSNKDVPPAAYYKILRDPLSTMENTTHLFLGVRFNCNKCHDHPFERWTQDQYYQTAAFFAQVDLKQDPQSGGRQLGQTAVEKGKPLYEIVYDKKEGEVKHDRTGQETPPEFPFASKYDEKDSDSRRQKLAAWLTSPDNAYFARSYVNRIWGYLLGVGIMEPIDDLRAGNPPTNPELLAYLTDDFVKSGFNVQDLVKQICKSRTYQLSVTSNRWNADDKTNYSHALARRLPAEVLFDAVHAVTGSVSNLQGYKPGTRAAELASVSANLAAGFLQTFGRPARESACECERSGGMQLGPVMAMISGPTISDAIANPRNDLTKMVAAEKDNEKLVNQLFLRVLNRPATPAELKASLAAFGQIDGDHKQLVAALGQKETDLAPLYAQQERQREESLSKAQADLTTYDAAQAPKRAELEKERQGKIDKLTQELADYEAKLPEKQPAWEKKQAKSAEWVVLKPTTLKASNEAELKVLDDGSVIASGKQGTGRYTFTAETDLSGVTGITGVRLEMLPDEKLPGGGPGRAKDGNFVLTEFELSAAKKSSPTRQDKVELIKPLADFSQRNFDIKLVLDGATNADKGWGVSPRTGEIHWATFEIKKPLQLEGGAILTFSLNQVFNRPDFMIGRFRISITTAPAPLGLTMPHEITAALAVAPEERDDAQKAALLKFFINQDAEHSKKREALADSKQPLPADPMLEAKKALVAELSKPTPTDSKLVQLREDVKMSEQQLANERLTAIQDLTWALINSPAFLFNH